MEILINPTVGWNENVWGGYVGLGGYTGGFQCVPNANENVGFDATEAAGVARVHHRHAVFCFICSGEIYKWDVLTQRIESQSIE